MEKLLTLTDLGHKKLYYRPHIVRISKNIRATSSTNQSKPLERPVWPPVAANFMLASAQKNAKLRQNEIDEWNNFNRCKMRKIKPLVYTGYDPNATKVPFREKFDIPEETKAKYSKFIRPMNDLTMNKLMRPKIYCYLEVKNLRPLGRLVIQLFTEACPEVVLEFVRMCMKNNFKLLRFSRLFPNLWMEGILMFNSPTLQEPNFEFKTQVIDHGYGPGILSFSKRYCDTGFMDGVIDFSLSFKPLVVANEDRVVFGVVTRGLRMLDVLQDFGVKNGKITKDIIVIKCGMIR